MKKSSTRTGFRAFLMLAGLLMAGAKSSPAEVWTIDVHAYGGTPGSAIGGDTVFTSFGIDTINFQYTTVLQAQPLNPQSYSSTTHMTYGILFTAESTFGPTPDSFPANNNAVFHFDIYPEGIPGFAHTITVTGTLSGTLSGTAAAGGQSTALWNLTGIDDVHTTAEVVNTASFIPSTLIPAWQLRTVIDGKPVVLWMVPQAQILGPGISHHLTGYIADGVNTVSVSGRVELQASLNSTQSLDFTFRPAVGAAFTRTATLTSDGSYTITDVPANNYTVSIKGTRWLRENISVNAIAGNVTNANAALRTGDANNDNVADIRDLLLLIAHYNQAVPSNDYSEAVDFNGDGADDIADLILLIGNYNTQGEPLP